MSDSSAEHLDDPIQEGPLHPFLEFEAGSFQSRRCQKLRRMRIGAHAAIDWEELGVLGATERAREFIGGPGSPWDRLFEFAYQPSFRELVVEVYSSFVFRADASPAPVDGQPHQISFRLAGVQRDMSLATFAVLTGLYTQAEIGTPLYTDGVWEAPRATLERFWLLIGRGRFIGPKAAATRIIDPLYRYLHMAIATSIAPRGRGREHCTERDLFFMYCLIWRQPCALARCLAQFFASAHTRRGIGRLYGGAYITIIARALGYVPDIDHTLSPAVAPTWLGRRSLNSMRLVRTIDGHLVFRTRQGGVFQPVPLPDELPELPADPAAAPAAVDGAQEQQPAEDPPALHVAAMEEDDDAGLEGGPGGVGDGPPHAPQYPQHVYREVRLCPADRALLDRLARDQRYLMDCVGWIMPRLAEMAEAAGRPVPPPPVRVDHPPSPPPDHPAGDP